MMGKKERHFGPLINVSLEELVPLDHFYRHLERTLDLSFVREFVQETYAVSFNVSVCCNHRNPCLCAYFYCCRCSHPESKATALTGDPVPLRMRSGNPIKVKRLPTN
jgi:hypothetical protein